MYSEENQHVVTSQEELDRALTDFGGYGNQWIIIDAPPVRRISLLRESAARIRVQGETRIREISGDVKVYEVAGHAVIFKLAGRASVEQIIERATIRSALENASIGIVSGHAVVRRAKDQVVIRGATGDARIDVLDGGAVVELADGDAALYDVRGHSSVSILRGGSCIQVARGRANVGAVLGQAGIQLAEGTVYIRKLGESAYVHTLKGRAHAVAMEDESRVRLIEGSAVVGRMSGRSLVSVIRDQGSVLTMTENASVWTHSGVSTVMVSGAACIERASWCTSVIRTAYASDPKWRSPEGSISEFDLWAGADAVNWCHRFAVPIKDGRVRLYKMVSRDLYAGHNHTPTEYPIGEQVACDDWEDNHYCGGGLHLAPSPAEALRHGQISGQEERCLEVEVELDDIRVIGNSKVKVPKLTVIREIDLDGRPMILDASKGGNSE